MPLFRRRPAAAPAAASFEPVARAVDGAQRALLAAIPTSRDRGVPLAEALLAFRGGLADARAALAAWRADADPGIWEDCRRALDDTAAEAERLRLDPRSLTFEELNARVGDVLHPLGVFADTERSLRGLG